MINSVGLENPGVEGFIEKELPFFEKLDLVRIANVGGGCLEDYIKGVELLNDKDIDIIELNISCPNVKAGGMAFGIKSEVANCGKNEEFFIKVEVVADGRGKSGIN